jgi:hypothetical protein
MDDWFVRLETALGQWATGIESEVDQLTDEVFDRLERCQKITDRLVDQAIDLGIDLGVEILGIAPRSELEATADRWGDEIIGWFFGLEQSVDQFVQRTDQMVDPIANNHPVCTGCRHYHGQSYGGEMLVCGMHPYGCETETCPDWESTWKG